VDTAERFVREFLALPEPPTALFTGNNRMTVGALRVLGGNSVRFALVGFDDIELAELLAVPVTLVVYDAAELGRQAAELIVRRLAGGDSAPRRVVLSTTLIERGKR
jgi:LacI family transcriptional regulator